MNTTQLYVEPVIVGVLVCVVFGIPFVPGLMLHGSALPRDITIVNTGVLIGLAYITGILADRVLDSCFDVMEQHNRLRYAWQHSENRLYVRDLFPEDHYRVRILAKGNRINDLLAYVRTRMRILRAIAFFAPGTACAIVLTAMSTAQYTSSCMPAAFGVCAHPVNWLAGLEFWFVPLVYSATALASIARWPSDPVDMQHDEAVRGTGRWAPPRTDRIGEIEHYAVRRNWTSKKQPNLLYDIRAQPVVIGASILIIVAFAVACISAVMGFCEATRCANGLARCSCRGIPLLVVALVGAILTLAAGWAWWRTTRTFFTYVDIGGKQLQD